MSIKIYTDRQWRFAFEIYCLGYSQREISRWLGVHKNTVNSNFNRLGLTPIRENLAPLSIYTKKFHSLAEDDTDARS